MSATIIDTLIVKLGLDSKDLTSKGGSASKTLKGLESSGEGASESIKGLTRSLGSFLAILGGTVALKAFVEDTIASSAALDRLSKNLGIGVQELSAWGNAVEEMGGSAKGLQGTLSMLSAAQTELRYTGQSALIPYFNTLGIAVAGVGGQVRPVNDLLLDIAERFQHLDRPTANNLGKMMGIDQDTLNLLLQGRREVELMINRQKQFNAVSKAQAEESAKLQRSIIGLKQSFTALGRDLLQQASPAIEKMLSVLSGLASWVQNNREFIGDLAKILGAVAAGLTLISIASSPITLTVLAIGALAVAIGLLWQDYQVWQRGGQSLIDWDKWKPGLDAAATGIKLWARAITTEFDAIVTAAKVAQAVMRGDWAGAKKALVSGTEKMNEKWGIGGPDEAHDQNVSKTDAIVKKASNWFKSTVKAVAGNQAGFEIPGSYTPGALASGIARAEGFNAKVKTPNRPQRNHNPGDMEYGPFAKDHGATGSDGRFAIFPDDETGYKAMEARLSSGQYAGKTDAEKLKIWAPASENDTVSYAANALSGIKGAGNTARAAGSRGGSSTSTSSDNSVKVDIGSMTIQTAATDADGIASHIVKSVHNQFTAAANGGLN